MDTAVYPRTVKGVLNFAASHEDGGEFSNTSPEISKQNLVSRELDIRNGRTWSEPPTLEREGLRLVDHAAGEGNFTDKDWLMTSYADGCVELIKRLTGAKKAVSIFNPVTRRVNFGDHKGAAPTAGFVHMDLIRSDARKATAPFVQGLGEVNYDTARVYNVWKSITPPPQDYPLAVGDRWSVPPEDHVQGSTVEYVGEDRKEKLISPYVTLVASDKPKFYYFPDMTPDESIVFIGLDFDPSKPLACPHTAFKHPNPAGPTVPRASVEHRVLAFFE